LATLQRALNPQAFTHGSEHFWRIQALVGGHSGLMEHSGRQLGGVPMKVAAHEQAAFPFSTLHSELGPQGDGWQGLSGVVGGFRSS